MELTYAYQEWPYAETFRISRGASTVSPLFLAVLRDGEHWGRGECGVLSQYGETCAGISRRRTRYSGQASRVRISQEKSKTAPCVTRLTAPFGTWNVGVQERISGLSPGCVDRHASKST